MSDVSQGPGWWQASDGKWYAPELYPTDWVKPDDATVFEAESVTESTVPPGDAALAPADAVPTTEEQAAPVGAAEFEAPSASDVPTAALPVVESPPTQVVPSLPPLYQPPPDSPHLSAPESFPTASGPAFAQPTAAPAYVSPAASAPIGSPTQWAPPTAPPMAGDSAPVPEPPLEEPAEVTIPAEIVRRRAPDIFTAILGVAGAALLVVGSVLGWAEASGDHFTGAVNGLSDSNGLGTLLAGAVVAMGALLAVAGRRAWWVGAGISAAALVASGLAVFSLVDIANLSADLPELLLVQDQDPELLFGLGLDYATGLWLVIAGAGVSVVAGMVALARRIG